MIKSRNTRNNTERRILLDSVLFRLSRHSRLAKSGMFGGFLLSMILFIGCHSAKVPQPAAPTSPSATKAPAPPKPIIAWAEVASVNAVDRYVVLHAKGLISVSGEATVWRGTNEVARLRVSGPARPAWLTADILSGHPQPGDRVELRIIKNIKSESGGQ